MTSVYPLNRKERDLWILARRPERNPLSEHRPVSFFTERERSKSGEIVDVATIFLSNRECPWRCVMCDLWQNTLTETVSPESIPEQMDFALGELGPARHLKLYNSGSFFDVRAIPSASIPAIAERCAGFETVVVESHPLLVGESSLRFRDLLHGRLEVAMGLETANPKTLELLNKGMTLEQFESSAGFLRSNDIDLRVFILVKPPFQDESEALHWARASIDLAFDCGASAVSLIPTRAGNGALEALATTGEFTPPRLAMLEAAHDYGVASRRGRVFADLWDLEPFSNCATCFPARIERMREMNLSQQSHDQVRCSDCGGGL